MEVLKTLTDVGVIGFLLLLSVLSLAIAIERWRYYGKIDLAAFKDKRALEIDLTNRLYVISSIGSSAPYIGLLGTVLGIMITFQTIGKEGFFDTGGIMVGLSMALKATVMGLIVAIPAVYFYNFLLRRVRVLLTQWEINNERKGI
jgi:biopolymer transport protein ExbB